MPCRGLLYPGQQPFLRGEKTKQIAGTGQIVCEGSWGGAWVRGGSSQGPYILGLSAVVLPSLGTHITHIHYTSLAHACMCHPPSNATTNHLKWTPHCHATVKAQSSRSSSPTGSDHVHFLVPVAVLQHVLLRIQLCGHDAPVQSAGT